MAGNQASRRIDLSLTIEAVEQRSTDGLGAGWQVIQPIPLPTGQSRWRNVEVTCEIDRHRPMQEGASRRSGTSRIGAPGADPLEDLVDRVGVSKNVVGRLPVGMLVGAAEPGYSERGRIGQRTAEVHGSRPRPGCGLERADNGFWFLAQQVFSQGRVLRPGAVVSCC